MLTWKDKSSCDKSSKVYRITTATVMVTHNIGGYITVTVVMRYAQLPLAQLDSSCITPTLATRMMLLAQRSTIHARGFSHPQRRVHQPLYICSRDI